VDEGANKGFLVTFDTRTRIDETYDRIWILDACGAVLASFSGRALAGATIAIKSPGCFSVRLTASSRRGYWGFAVTSVERLVLTQEDAHDVVGRYGHGAHKDVEGEE
jgi:hypothetical protein